MKEKLLNLGEELSRNEMKQVLGGAVYDWFCSVSSGQSNQDCNWWNTNGPAYCAGRGQTYVSCNPVF